MRKEQSDCLTYSALALSAAIAFSACQSTPTAATAELMPLQGLWEGEGAGGKCSITIEGNSLHYRAGTNWWQTNFTLPAGNAPRQLHATIADSSPPASSVGTEVFALFKLEGNVLTLAVNDGSDTAPETFASASSRYIVKKVRP